MSLRLPERPNLALLKRQAKAALRVGRVLHPSWRLADAQRALAKSYGVSSWATLKHEIAARRRVTRSVDTVGGSESTRANLETVTPARVPDRFVGTWIARAGETDRVALEIADVAGVLQLTQVIAGEDGHGSASSLSLWTDGREHPLPAGDGLRMRATWSDDHTLDTTVTRSGDTVATGRYALSHEGHTLSVSAGSMRVVFERAVLITMIVVSCSCAGTSRRDLTPRQPDPNSDMKAIVALNQHDVTAAMASDVDAIVSQWTEDFVLLSPAGPIVRGRAANAAMIAAARHQIETFEPVAYEVNFEEIVVAGDYAFAWGRYRAAARPRAGGGDIVSNGKLLRIYQRQSDGRWLMHRTMTTMDQPRQ